jgi:hypothetical protein
MENFKKSTIKKITEELQKPFPYSLNKMAREI